jgi:hypothetical protein
MKVILVLILVAAGAILAFYYGAGYASFDPSEQGRQAKAAIKPGMSWKKVADIAGEPKEYQLFIESKKRIGNEERTIVKPGARNRFDPKVLAGRVESNTIPQGFIFHYYFSDSVAFQVQFDGAGTVTGVHDNVTVADLLGLRGDE